MATSEFLKAALIGLNIAGLSYGSAKRRAANEAIEKRDREEKEAAAAAKQQMHTWMQIPGQAPFKVRENQMIPPNATIFATRVGESAIKYTDPKIEQKQMYAHPTFGVGTQKEIETRAVASGNKFFSFKESGAKLTGFINFNPKTGKRSFTELPASMRPQIDKDDRYVTFGSVTNASGKQERVYAANPTEFKEQYGKEPIGSIAMSRAFVAGLNANKNTNIDFDALSKKQVNIFPKDKDSTGDKARMVHYARVSVGENKFEYLYNDDINALLDNVTAMTKTDGADVVEMGEVQFTGTTRTGKHNPIKPAKTSPKQVIQLVSAYPVDEKGNKIGGNEEMTLSDFRKRNKNKITFMTDQSRAYYYQTTAQDQQIPKDGVEINPRVSTTATMKAAMDKANAVTFQPVDKSVHKNANDLFITKEFKTDLTGQRNKLSDWILSLPKDNEGRIDWQGLGFLDQAKRPTDRLRKLVTFSMNLVEGLSQPSDNRDIKTPMSAQRALFMNAKFFPRRFTLLDKIPFLREELKMKAHVDKFDARKSIYATGAMTDEGTEGENIILEENDVPIKAKQQNPGNSDIEEDIPATILQGVQLGTRKYGPTIKLAATLLAEDDSDEARSAVESAIAKNVIRYQRGSDGQLMYDSKNSLLTLPSQPQLNFLKQMTELTDASGDPMLMTYIGMVRGEPMLNTDIVNDIKIKFRKSVGNNYDYAHKLIGIATPEVEGTSESLMLWQRQTGLSEEKWGSVQDGWVSQATAAGTSENFIDAALSTFRYQDGTIIPFGTAIGQWVVAADGFLYVSRQLAQQVPIIRDAAKVAPTQVRDLMNNNINSFQSILDTLPDSEIRKMAKDRNISYEEFVEKEKAAAAANKEMWERTVIANSGPSETVSKLSMRNYYRYMIAYTVASAIQGGTGGRTISDQDVQNILNAMKMDTLFTRPENEVKILLAMKRNMQRIKTHYGHLAAGDKRRYAALVMQDFDLAPSTNSLLIASEVEQPNTQSAVNQVPANRPISAIMANMTDADKTKLLKSINKAQAFVGNQFSDLAQAQKELGDSVFYENLTPFITTQE